MAWSNVPQSVEYNDEEKYEIGRGMPLSWDPPDYPGNLQFSITKADLATAGYEGGKPGNMMHFSAMGVVKSTYHGMDDCRIELEATQFAGDDGKFFDLSQSIYLCLCRPDLEKIDLEEDCEKGDMIHLIGKARLESKASNEYGEDMARLQIVELTFEDESAESREG